MLSDRALIQLRVAATLAHAVPGMRLRICDGERCVLHVRPSPDGDDVSWSPCAFRWCVVRAWARRRLGERIAMAGLASGQDPRIEVGLVDGHRVLPGGLHEFVMLDTTALLFAVALPVASCRTAAHDLEREVRMQEDPGTGVTLVSIATPSDDHRARRRARDVLETILARCVAEELVRELAVAD